MLLPFRRQTAQAHLHHPNPQALPLQALKAAPTRHAALDQLVQVEVDEFGANDALRAVAVQPC